MSNTIPISNTAALQSLRRRIARRLVRLAFGGGRSATGSALLPSFGIHRILICHVSHTLGNTLLLTPLLRELENIYPGAEVDVVTRSPVAEKIFGSFRCVRHIYRLPRHGVAAPWQLWRIVRTLRSQNYDLAIDPCVSSQSDRIGVLATRATKKLGFVAAGKSGVLSHGVARPETIRHVGQLPVYLLRSATGRAVDEAYPPLDVCLTPSERELGAEFLAGLVSASAPAAPVIGLFTSATGPKRLGAQWWRQFATRLAARAPGVPILEIVPVSGAAVLGDGFPTFYSSDLRRLACVLSGLSLFVSADCGIMHLACASGTPTVALFSVTDAKMWGPYGSRDAVLEIGTRTPEQVADAVPLTPGA
ncbi:MAG TPA: glycosyltransferase family 9 protein [Rhodanobacteraceae bacterium]|jgi:ADP-heptose:LPS heptosyltransferase|nr:glycosyltransferase family 9 protein [Rhodanobacteraceae bacterium]